MIQRYIELELENSNDVVGPLKSHNKGFQLLRSLRTYYSCSLYVGTVYTTGCSNNTGTLVCTFTVQRRLVSVSMCVGDGDDVAQ